MKILLVDDGSSYADISIEMMKALQLPPETEVTIMTVVPEHTFLGGITLNRLRSVSLAKELQQQKVLELLKQSVQALSTSKLKVNSMVRWGNPAEEILKAVDEDGTSLLVIGAKGPSDPIAFHLNSIAMAVMKHARANVLLVRQANRTTDQASLPEKKAVVKRVMLAADGSKHSDMVTSFLTDMPLPRNCEIIVITALQSHLAAWIKTPTLDFQTNQELLVKLQAAEEDEARKITARSENKFREKGYRCASVIVRGGAAESILAAAKEYKPDIIALGSRGLSRIESLLLGNVAERVARYADCSVLIGRGPLRVKG